MRGPDFLIVGALSGLNNIFFTLAVFNTTTANVVFILAFNPMIASLLSWKIVGEIPSGRTFAAIAALSCLKVQATQAELLYALITIGHTISVAVCAAAGLV